MRKFTVGQRVWAFDENRRVYTERAGRLSGDLIYAGHFREMKVLAIDKRSYLIGWPDGKGGEKVGFAKAERMYYTDQDREDRIWKNDHRYKIVRLVERADVATLRKIAAIVGYKEEA
jgi:hypothetical protein